MDKLEPIRRVFRDAGLYNHAADDVLCERLANAPQPQAEPVAADVEALALRLESLETTDTDCLDAAAMLRRMAAPAPRVSAEDKP